jgi:hypothetical protein
MMWRSPIVFNELMQEVIDRFVGIDGFVYRCLSFCHFSFFHCVVCSSSIYEFWCPLWYHQTLVDHQCLTVLLIMQIYSRSINCSMYHWCNPGIVHKRYCYLASRNHLCKYLKHQHYFSSRLCYYLLLYKIIVDYKYQYKKYMYIIIRMYFYTNNVSKLRMNG